MILSTTKIYASLNADETNSKDILGLVSFNNTSTKEDRDRNRILKNPISNKYPVSKSKKTNKLSRTLEKLNSSPFLPTQSDHNNLKSLLPHDVSLKISQSLNLGESDWSLRNHASDILSSKPRSGVNRMFEKISLERSLPPKSGPIQEIQGPHDWSHKALKIKYRGEKEREAIWNASQNAAFLASKTFDFDEIVLPTAKIERHPVFDLYDRMVNDYNYNTQRRTKSRLQMKRFVIDVQEVWLTNLQHLREFQSSQILQPSSAEIADAVQSMSMGLGLEGRRDIYSLESMHHQVQSVIHRRALIRAFYTTRMPESNVVLDFIPSDTPHLHRPKPLPPTIETLSTYLIEHSTDPTVVTEMNAKVFNLLLHQDIQRSLHHSRPLLVYSDRLLPSADFNMRHQNVLWRFNVFRQDCSTLTTFIVTETAIESCVNELIRVEKSSYLTSVKKKYHSITLNNIEIACESKTITTQVVINVMELHTITLVNFQVDKANNNQYSTQTLLSLDLPLEDVANFLNVNNVSTHLEDIGAWWESVSSEESLSLWQSLLNTFNISTSSHENQNILQLTASLHRTHANTIFGALSTSTAYFYSTFLSNYTFIDFDTNNNDCMLHIKCLAPNDIFHCSSDRCYIPDANLYTPLEIRGQWEKILDLDVSLSVKVSGAGHKVSQVPGTCEHGRKGLWFKYDKEGEEFTQACALYFRDPRISTSNAVLINIVLALDTPVIFTAQVAWEELQIHPPKCQAEEVIHVIPSIATKPMAMYFNSPMKTSLDERVSFPAMIFSSIAEEGRDHQPLDLGSKPPGFCRYWAERNEYGFRRKITITLHGVDPVLPTIVFGITKNGAQPNTTSVCPRNIWHGTLAVTEHINRPRTSKDYHYIIATTNNCGANDSASFSVNLKGSEFVGLTRTDLASYETNYSEIQERRFVFNRQIALDAKVELIEVLMKTREKGLKVKLAKELQMALEKKLRKSNKSEKGWRRRMYMSTLLEVQASWERRRDDRSGAIFFRRINISSSSDSIGNDNARGHDKSEATEKYLDTCQWEIPATWDGDPLAIPRNQVVHSAGNNARGSSDTTMLGKEAAMKQTGLDGEVGAFDEPREDWMPVEFVVDDKTPGTQAKTRMYASATAHQFQEIRSISADKSLSSETTDAASIDTKNLEHIAEQLLSSDELMRAFAKRLGIPEKDVVPVNDLNSVFSLSDTSSRNDGFDFVVPDGPRDKWVNETDEGNGIDSDDELWSDDEDEAGNHDENDMGDDLCETQEEKAIMKRKEVFALQGDKFTNTVPKNIPFLNLADKGLGSNKSGEEGVGMAWKKLPRADINPSFLQKCINPRTLGPDANSSNTLNAPIYLLSISPVDACVYEPDPFTFTVASIFIPNAKTEMERAIATLDRQVKREDELSRNLPTDDLLLFGEAKEVTVADTFLARQHKQDQDLYKDPREAAIDSAIVAAKSSNIAQMEDALEEEIPVDSTDQYGNTLLILSAQQGSKRMCKFLLRRGGNVNLQNLSGNTCLHYCYAYGHEDIGIYLKSRGADDSIVNADGMTCYEGLSNSALEEN